MPLALITPMSDTPRTDMLAIGLEGYEMEFGAHEHVRPLVGLCRDLEREVNRALDRMVAVSEQRDEYSFAVWCIESRLWALRGEFDRRGAKRAFDPAWALTRVEECLASIKMARASAKSEFGLLQSAGAK